MFEADGVADLFEEFFPLRGRCGFSLHFHLPEVVLYFAHCNLIYSRLTSESFRTLDGTSKGSYTVRITLVGAASPKIMH